MDARFEVFPAKTRSRLLLTVLEKEQWYWRLRAANGEIVARSSEGYADGWGARRGVTDAVATVAAASGVVIDPANVEVLAVEA